MGYRQDLTWALEYKEYHLETAYRQMDKAPDAYWKSRVAEETMPLEVQVKNIKDCLDNGAMLELPRCCSYYIDQTKKSIFCFLLRCEGRICWWQPYKCQMSMAEGKLPERLPEEAASPMGGEVQSSKQPKQEALWG